MLWTVPIQRKVPLSSCHVKLETLNDIIIIKKSMKTKRTSMIDDYNGY